MGSAEYKELKAQMDRIERMLAQLAGGAAPVPPPVEQELPPRPAPPSPDQSQAARTKALQEEGRFILATQGADAFAKYWKDLAKKDRKPRVRRAA